MKIAGLETHLLRCPLPDEQKLPVASFVEGGILLLRVVTDAGVFGWGEPSPYGASLHATRAILDSEIRELLRGKEPTEALSLTHQNETRGQHTYGAAAWNVALAAVSQALWDIIAKTEGKPLYRILNPSAQTGATVRAYSSGGMIFEDSPRSWLIDEALRARDQGYTAFKFRPTTPRGAGSHFQRNLSPPPVDLKDLEATCRELRRSLGVGFDLMLDAGCRVASFAEATWLADLLSELRFSFLEEPMPRDVTVYSRLAARRSVPLATGECFYSAAQFRRWLEAGAVDVLQPDANFAGITDILEVGALAASTGKPLVLHSWASAVSVAANAHVAAAIPQCTMLEYNTTHNPYRTELVREAMVPVNGTFTIPDRPGLGVEIDEKTLRRYSV